MKHEGRHNQESEAVRLPWWRFPPLLTAIVAGLIAGAGFFLSHADIIAHSAENWFYWLAIPVGAWHWAREGLRELFSEGEVGIEVLMMAATAGSGLLGLWDEAAALVVLYAAAEGVEEYTYARTRSAIRALLDLAPKEARLVSDGGGETVVAADQLRLGEVFRVRPGESLPTDGIVISGRSSVDQSAVTGESVPVDKDVGARVFAASINRQGMLDVRVEATFADNSLSRVIHLVEEAQEQKGRAQQWIDRFGRRYTPAVLASAVLLVAIPWWLGLSLTEWSYRAVVLLVAAAPCALIMSTPVAMAAAIGAAGRRGILIKGGVHLEHLGSIRVVAFDKTGTLTVGKPAVTDLLPVGGTRQEVLGIAATLERHSEHPLAQAIMEYAQHENLALADPVDFEALLGAGARATVNGNLWYIGSPALFEQLGAPIQSSLQHISSLQGEGKTVVVVGNAERLLGVIALRDSPRQSASAIIHALKRAGTRTVMLTGDNGRTGEALARELGIDEVRAELKPHDKVNAVKQLLVDYGPVLMIGDGVNDAPALAAATCGMAMGAAGTDAAIEAADIALMTDDLRKVEVALGFGRKSQRVSRQNIVFSIAVLLVLVPSSLLGILSVTLAVITHEASELLAVLNGLRAGRSRALVKDRSGPTPNPANRVNGTCN